MNNEMVCADCNNTFQGLDKSMSPIKHCPKCVEVMQERMLTAIFGKVKGN